MEGLRTSLLCWNIRKTVDGSLSRQSSRDSKSDRTAVGQQVESALIAASSSEYAQYTSPPNFQYRIKNTNRIASTLMTR